MKYRKMDAAGDYTLGTGADFWQDVPEAPAQAAGTVLRLLQGEWFLDLTDGTPWRTDVLGKYTSTRYDAVIKQRLLSAQGVKSILAYSSTFNGSNRSLTVSVTLDTIYGAATVSGTLGTLDGSFILDVSTLG